MIVRVFGNQIGQHRVGRVDLRIGSRWAIGNGRDSLRDAGVAQHAADIAVAKTSRRGAGIIHGQRDPERLLWRPSVADLVIVARQHLPSSADIRAGIEYIIPCQTQRGHVV